MDKSKMAKPGTTINYDGRKGGVCHEQMSRKVDEGCSSEYCYCDKCRDGKADKSLDDTLNPPPEDDDSPVCC
jgi:hypothetical protein